MEIEILLALNQEWLLCLSIFLLLILFLTIENINQTLIAHTIHALLLVQVLFIWAEPKQVTVFNGMYTTNGLIQFQKSLLSLGFLLISALSLNWLKNCKSIIEFYILLLSSLLGMYFMLSASHMLMFYLGLEMATIPLAAAANLDIEKRKSGEAAMKLIYSSAFSSAILLMGISLIYGACGSLHFAEISNNLVQNNLSIFGFIMLFSGFAFKISAVPFHLWTADVYEGAPLPITAFLSVVSKMAVSFVFIKILFQVFVSLEVIYTISLSVLSILTMVVGNLFAIRQENMKRFLAFSSITQVAYILIALMGLQGMAQGAIIYFLLIYLFSTVAAFGVIGIVSEAYNKENISDYKGFYAQNKFLSWTLAIALFSLAGVPPTAGFFGKFFLVMAGASKGYFILIIIAALNMIISFYYYLRIVRYMFMEEATESLQKISVQPVSKLALIICLLGMVCLGLYGPVYEYILTFSNTL
ncbi:MAG: NADH-quinone oxidoreductase subunit N [Bacteroidia bacterium]|nr:NADH-quinone oxidoreductase subunit N [Bacteroidia bacterium]